MRPLGRPLPAMALSASLSVQPGPAQRRRHSRLLHDLGPLALAAAAVAGWVVALLERSKRAHLRRELISRQQEVAAAARAALHVRDDG